ncbi:MAG: malonyl-CoA decarboxylase [Paracoccaceae bacterium]
MTEAAGASSTSLFGDMLARITDAGRALIGSEEPRPPIEMAERLMATGGEATSTARARDVLDAYAALPATERRGFLEALAHRFGPDLALVDTTVAAYLAERSTEAARRLHVAAEPRSQALLRLLNRAPGGTRSLVAMREDLIAALREDAGLQGLDDDFRHLFASWFNRGFLELRRIDWNTSAAILEKVIHYEAVHAIQGWRDLRARVAAPDRQLYAFFHPALPDDPLIFVEVALTAEIPGAIGPILTEEREPLAPERATTAVFYSISNCQKGLRGVSFGNFLIKQVVEELRRDFENLATFVTLSPVPGFARWLDAEGIDAASLGRPKETRTRVAAGTDLAVVDERAARKRAAAREEALASLCARYLTDARRGDGLPLDPVARFHLGNGARLERVNAGADLSTRGRAESHGVMVNYLYDLRDIEKNHEAFVGRGEVAQSSAVRRQARAAPSPPSG